MWDSSSCGSLWACAGATATVPRLYHGIASLVPSGGIITAGSNPQGSYYFQSDPATGVFPAELRVEYYYPWCLPAPAMAPFLLSHLRCIDKLGHFLRREASRVCQPLCHHALAKRLPPAAWCTKACVFFCSFLPDPPSTCLEDTQWYSSVLHPL